MKNKKYNLINLFLGVGLLSLMLVTSKAYSADRIEKRACYVDTELDDIISQFYSADYSKAYLAALPSYERGALRIMVDSYNKSFASDDTCSVNLTNGNNQDEPANPDKVIYFSTYEWDMNEGDASLDLLAHAGYVDNTGFKDALSNDVAKGTRYQPIMLESPLEFTNSSATSLILGNSVYSGNKNNDCFESNGTTAKQRPLLNGDDPCVQQDLGFIIIDARSTDYWKAHPNDAPYVDSVSGFHASKRSNKIAIRSHVFVVRNNIQSVTDFGFKFVDGGGNYFCKGKVNWGSASKPILPGESGWCDPDADNDDYTVGDGDCDDKDPNVNPGATEVPSNLIDDNCDGVVINNFPIPSVVVMPKSQADIDIDHDGFYADTNGDGKVVTSMGAEINDIHQQDCSEVGVHGVTDPNIARKINPIAKEICDGIDNNCDGVIDEGNTCDKDLDGDGYYTDNNGDGIVPVKKGTWLPGPKLPLSGKIDCNDTNPAVNPGATEVCNGIDDNCDGVIDEGSTCDQDGDGYCSGTTCTSGSLLPGDCNDTNPAINPAASELCNGIDDNCNGTVDDNPTDGARWYPDLDHDSYGQIETETETSVKACTQPVGYVSDHSDCDDAAHATYPGATEICDGIDNDCDGLIDVSMTAGGPVACVSVVQDADGDGYCVDPTSPSCPAGSHPESDCNDTNSSVHPGATELCDGIDNDCDGTVDGASCVPVIEDADRDGYCSGTTCTASGLLPGDCIDTNNSVHPGAPEVCGNTIDDNCDGQTNEGCDSDSDGDPDVTDCQPLNNQVHHGAIESCGDGIDNNCDGTVDEASCIVTNQDVDGDGYCLTPSSTYCTTGNTEADCDDTNSAVNPGATEVCDTLDNDCDGSKNEGLTCTGIDNDGDGFPVTVDCNDSDSTIHPGAIENCSDNIDQNCNGTVDDLDPACTSNGSPTVDNDDDGFCESTTSCTDGSKVNDCNDANKDVNPSAQEICSNHIDDNCDGKIDEAGCTVPGSDPGIDDDHDGYCDSFTACTDGSTPGDCNDANANINPGIVESSMVCSGSIDFNCDGIACDAVTDVPGGFPATVKGNWFTGGCSLTPASSASPVIGLLLLAQAVLFYGWRRAYQSK